MAGDLDWIDEAIGSTAVAEDPGVDWIDAAIAGKKPKATVPDPKALLRIASSSPQTAQLLAQSQGLRDPATQKMLAAAQRAQSGSTTTEELLADELAKPQILDTVNAASGLVGGISAIASGVNRLTGQAASADEWSRLADMTQKANSAANLKKYSDKGADWADLASNNLASITQNLPGMAVGGVVGGLARVIIPTAMAGFMQGNQSWTKARDLGLSKDDALGYAAAQGAAEAIPEAIGNMFGAGAAMSFWKSADKLSGTSIKDAVRQAAAKGFASVFRNVLKDLGVEQATELVTSVSQQAINNLYGIDPKNIDPRTPDGLENLKKLTKDTFWATLMQSVMMVGPTTIAEQIQNNPDRVSMAIRQGEKAIREAKTPEDAKAAEENNAAIIDAWLAAKPQEQQELAGLSYPSRKLFVEAGGPAGLSQAQRRAFLEAAQRVENSKPLREDLGPEPVVDENGEVVYDKPTELTPAPVDNSIAGGTLLPVPVGDQNVSTAIEPATPAEPAIIAGTAPAAGQATADNRAPDANGGGDAGISGSTRRVITPEEIGTPELHQSILADNNADEILRYISYLGHRNNDLEFSENPDPEEIRRNRELAHEAYAALPEHLRPKKTNAKKKPVSDAELRRQAVDAFESAPTPRMVAIKIRQTWADERFAPNKNRTIRKGQKGEDRLLRDIHNFIMSMEQNQRGDLLDHVTEIASIARELGTQANAKKAQEIEIKSWIENTRQAKHGDQPEAEPEPEPAPPPKKNKGKKDKPVVPPTKAANPRPQNKGGAAYQVAESQGNVDDIPVKLDGSGKTPGQHELTLRIHKLFNAIIRSGRMGSSQAAAYYKVHDRVIRHKSKYFGDLSITIHEIAHAVEWPARKLAGANPMAHPYRSSSQTARNELKALDYAVTKFGKPANQGRKHEGFAEFLRHYVTQDNAAQVAPEYFKHFEKWLAANPDIKAKVEKAREMVDQWRGAGAQGRAAGQLSKTGEEQTTDTTIEKIADLKEWVYTEAKDNLNPFKVFDISAEKKLGRKLHDEEKVYELARAFINTGAANAERSIEDGIYTLGGDGHPKKIGLSFREVMEPIQGEDVERAELYAYASHAIEAWARDINPGISNEDAKAVVEQINFETPDAAKKYQEFHRRLTEFNNARLAVSLDAGLITQQAYDKATRFWPNYIPLLRVQPKNGIMGGLGSKVVDVGSVLKARHGSGKQVTSPIAASLQLLVQTYNRAARQLVINQMAETREKVEDMGGMIEKVPPKTEKVTISVAEAIEKLKKLGMTVPDDIWDTMDPLDVLAIYLPNYDPDPKNHIHRIIRNGKPEMYQLNEEIEKTIAGMDPVSASLGMKILSAPAGMFRMGATGLSLAFQAKNVLRDLHTFLFNSRNVPLWKLPFTPFWYMGMYAYSRLAEVRGKKGNKIVDLYRRFGGELGLRLNMDMDHIRGAVNRAMANTRTSRVYNLVKPSEALDTIRAILSFPEVGPRLSEFVGVLEKHGYTKELLNAGEIPPRHVIVEAIVASKDATVDFSRIGRSGRIVNQLVPFANVTMESLDRQIRLVRSSPKETLFKMSVGMGIAAAIWALQNGDDEGDTEEEAWLRYGTIRVDQWRFPLSQEWGLATYALPKALLDHFYKKNPQALKDLAESAAKTFNPIDIPTFIKPILEVSAPGGGYDLFRGKPIETRGMQNLRPEDRWYPSTSWLAKQMGNLSGWSPAKIEHLIDGYMGGMYTRATRAVESSLKPGPAERADLPFVGAFRLRNAPKRSIDEFYEKMEEVNQTSGSSAMRDPNKKPAPEAKGEVQRYGFYSKFMSDIRDAFSGEKTQENVRVMDRALVGLARSAMGKEPLKDYPNPITDKNLDPKIQKVVDDYVGKAVMSLTQTTKRITPEEEDNAKSILEGLSTQEMMSAYRRAALSKGSDGKPRMKISGDLNSAYQKGLARLRARLR